MQNARIVTTLALGLLLASGCSLLNQFDDVVPQGEGGNGPTGDGDASGDGDVATTNNPGDGDGDGGMGGDASGGRSGSGGDTQEGSGGTGTGGTQPAEPGLVVVLPQIDGIEERSLVTISPQDGSLLHAMNQADDEVSFAAFEASRQTWFLNLNGKIVPATFDRTQNEWDLGSEGPETGGIVDPYVVFALPERLVVYEDSVFVVYDTSDLESIMKLDEFTMAEGTLWGVAAAEKTVGGDIHILTKHCATTDDILCPIELTRTSIQASGVQSFDPTLVAQVDQSLTKVARGNLRYDRNERKLALLIPNKEGLTGQASVDLWTTIHEHELTEEFRFQIPDGNSQIFSTMTIDHCDSVAYAMINNDTSLFGVPMAVDPLAMVMKQGVVVEGNGIVYEPVTRSILTTENTAVEQGIDSWNIKGDELVPSVSKDSSFDRIPVRPRYIAVQEDESIDCE